MNRRISQLGRAALALAGLIGLGPLAAAVANDGQCTIDRAGDRITITWPTAPGERGQIVLNLGRGPGGGGDRAGRPDLVPPAPLFAKIALGRGASGEMTSLLEAVDPEVALTVGSRVNPSPTPPGMSVFNVFFDSPARRPHRTYRVAWADPAERTARVETNGARASVAVGPVLAGPFRGEWVVTVYAGARLVRVEAVMRTTEDARAITYDAGLVEMSWGNLGRSNWRNIGRNLAWLDPQGAWQRREITGGPAADDRAHAARHRAIVLEAAGGGSVACFPAPHQFFFPRDWTDNLATTWSGAGHRRDDILPDEWKARLAGPGQHPQLPPEYVVPFGFGIRQPETGGGNYVPWFNAPPGTDQHLGAFYLLHPGKAEEALGEVLTFTHGDRFAPLPGYKTFSSHYHIAFTVEAMRQKAAGIDPPAVPPLVGVFKGLGVDAVHVAEFHGDGHPNDTGPVRLAELDAMFAECRRISDAELLVIPGEEANLHLGYGDRSGHWLEMFPRPVRFTMRGPADQPFERDGVYRLKDAADVLRLLKAERGLAWTAHARIKASNFAPDIYFDDPLFRDPTWLGAAWKAMPADLSRPRLGDRCLDLLDDMSNRGFRKQLLGEVDTFKTDATHEMYGHMNVNYVKLDRLPRFDEGWQPILDALRAGRFFVTTGEVLLHAATLGGADLGATLPSLPADAEVKVDLAWTFPLAFAEVVSGDGEKVYRDRIDLATTGAFGRQALTLRPDLRGRKWARFAAWDVAGNGAFTQPTWIGGE